MAEPARHLHVIDPETGEIHEQCPGCARLEDEIAGLVRDIRGWAARFAELKRDKDREARENPLWPKALELFGEWRRLCRHPRAAWSADRFFLVEPFLCDYGLELCSRAIAGAAFDAFETTRRNGSVKRHDGWELIFRDRGKFEEFCNRAPKAAAAGVAPRAVGAPAGAQTAADGRQAA